MPRKRQQPERTTAKLRQVDVGPRGELLNGEIFKFLREAHIIVESWRRQLHDYAATHYHLGTLHKSWDVRAN